MIRSAVLTRIALVAVPFCLLACSAEGTGSAVAPADEPTAATSQALTSSLPAGATGITIVSSIDVGNCIIHVGTATLSGPPYPPQSIAFAQRAALNASCAGALGYQVLGTTYGVPTVVIAEGAQRQIAVAYTSRPTPSGSAPFDVNVLRLNPNTLATIAADGLAVPPPGTNPSIWVSSIEFTVPGDLLVMGTKNGSLPGELGLVGGSNYQATYTNFAGSTTSHVAPNQVLAW